MTRLHPYSPSTANTTKSTIELDNLVTFHTGVETLGYGSDVKIAAYERVLRHVSDELKKRNFSVERGPFISSGNNSFDTCNGFTLRYQDKTMSYLHQENDRCPASWTSVLQAFDTVLASSPHFTHAAKEEEFAFKVKDVPLSGVDISTYGTHVEPLQDFFPGRFKFLMVAATQTRKNTATLIDIFKNMFGKRNDVVLILKSGGNGHDKNYQPLIQNSENIELITDVWSDEYLARVYKTVALEGAYVHPHRAECVGMPILEALVSGCRVGTTNWGGPKYFLSKSPQVEKFDYVLVPSPFQNGDMGQHYDPQQTPLWAEPSTEQIGSWMTRVMSENLDSSELAKSAHSYAERFSYGTLVDTLVTELTSGGISRKSAGIS